MSTGYRAKNGGRTYFVSGVCCATEEAVLRKTLDATIGPNGYAFNAVTCELSMAHSAGNAHALQRLRDAGFSTRSKQELDQEEPFWTRHAGAVLTSIAVLLAAAGIIIERHSPLASHTMLGLSIIVGGWKIFHKAYAAARTLTLDMNVLMSVAVLGALLIGKWEEGAAVIVLFAISLALESYSASRTRTAIRSLMRLSPDQASVLRDGHEHVLNAREVAPGEIIMIRPAERIPLDGVVLDGQSSIDESPLTGESHPVEKGEGEAVYAGSINGRGALRVQVTRRFEETTIARIIHLVEEAQQNRAPIQNFVERFAAIYTPAVLGAAVLVALVPPILLHDPIGTWYYRALVLLVIACPCALVISTPVTLVSALSSAARRGILIKGGKHLETLSTVHAVAFDKTGTITEGRTRVTDVIPLQSIPRDELLRIIAAIEQQSEHHLAGAILAEATRNGIAVDAITIDTFEAMPGRGIKASIGGETFYVGNSKLCSELGYLTPSVERSLDTFSRQGKTVIVLCNGTQALGMIAIQDVARYQSKNAIQRLRKLGIRHMMMLSGDNEATVQSIAAEVGINHYAAGLLPSQKVRVVEDLKQQYTTVAMVGDGINDTPALAASSVGIAMGTSGTDATLETADVVLMADDVGKLPLLFSLSRRAMRIIRQNIALALSLKVLFLVLSILGYATLWMAVLADDGAALGVIFNGLRILSHTDEA